MGLSGPLTAEETHETQQSHFWLSMWRADGLQFINSVTWLVVNVRAAGSYRWILPVLTQVSSYNTGRKGSGHFHKHLKYSNRKKLKYWTGKWMFDRFWRKYKWCMSRQKLLSWFQCVVAVCQGIATFFLNVFWVVARVFRSYFNSKVINQYGLHEIYKAPLSPFSLL